MAKKRKKNDFRVLYVNTLNLGVCYWRIENYAQTMVEFKDDCAVNVYYPFDPRDNIAWDAIIDRPGETPELIRQTLESQFQFFDAIIFQKIQSKPGLDFVIEMRNKYPHTRMIMEMDDIIGDITPSNIHIDRLKNESEIAAYQAQMSDAIIVSTQYLKDYAQKITGEDKPIFVAPNCLHPESWDPEIN